MSILKKNPNDKVFFGVCGGISKYTGIDSPIIRLGFIFGTIFTGTILFWIYVILALILRMDEE